MMSCISALRTFSPSASRVAGPSSSSLSKIRSSARPGPDPLRGDRGVPPSCTPSRSLGSACSSSRLVSFGRGAGVVSAESASASAEARKCSEGSFSALFDRCMSPRQRVAHVSDSVARLLSTQTRDMHVVMNSCGSLHGGGMHDNSFGVLHVNSGGAARHRNSCNSHSAELREETKTMSMSTRCKVGCPAGKEVAPLQQVPEKLHVETWEGRKEGPDLRISQHGELSSWAR